MYMSLMLYNLSTQLLKEAIHPTLSRLLLSLLMQGILPLLPFPLTYIQKNILL